MYSKVNVSVAAEMLESALAYCQKMEGKQATNLLKENDSNLIEYFRYKLAMEVGAYLGNNSEAITEVYLYTYTSDEELTLTLPLTLIVCVKKYTDVLGLAFVELQRNLLEEYRNTFSPTTDDLNIFLYLCFIDEIDQLNRKSWAACIGSLHNPAYRVWYR